MTTIGFHGPPPRATGPGPVVPRRSVPLVDGEAQVTMTRAQSTPRHLAPAERGWMRVGVVPLESAGRYLAAWSVGIFAVLLVVLLFGYALLSVLGVVGSVSRALGVLSGADGPSSLLQPGTVLPAILLGSLLLSGLWLIAAFGAVLVHNAVTSLTGGIRVRIRPDAGPPLPLARR